jgi:hypothetical protein
MCVFVENAGFGSAVAAPIARRILQKFFGREPDEIVVPNKEEQQTASNRNMFMIRN